MYRKDVNRLSPIRVLEASTHGGLGKGNLGLIMSRAGVGKTACLVQIGLDDLLRERPVLHVALDQTVAHAQSWYDALFDDLARASGLADPEAERRALSGRRLIASFADHDLWPERLEKSVAMFGEHLHTRPAAILVDGYPWDRHGVAENAAFVGGFKAYAKLLGAELWMTAQTHRSAVGARPGKLPVPYDAYAALVDVAILLEPHGDDVALELLIDHGAVPGAAAPLRLRSDTLRLYAADEVKTPVAMPPGAYTLLSGGAKGTEAEFGRAAEAWGLGELNFSFDGRSPERGRGMVILTDEELAHGAVSPIFIQARLSRTFPDAPLFRKMLQSIWHQVNTAGEVFCIGMIQPDQTVKGGTGWAVELAKLFNRPVSVFDQGRHAWFSWKGGRWEPDQPTIGAKAFCGTGTRNLTDEGRAAVSDLFRRSFGEPAA